MAKDVFRSIIEEQVAKFFFFHRYGKIVSHHFLDVLNAIIILEGNCLVQRS